MLITPLERTRSDIDCPGDTIPYTCFIEVINSNVLLHLIWILTYPGQKPIRILIDPFTTSSRTVLNGYVSASLTNFSNFADGYIESRLTITVQPRVDRIELQCLIEDLSSASTEIIVNSAGKQLTGPLEAQRPPDLVLLPSYSMSVTSHDVLYYSTASPTYWFYAERDAQYSGDNCHFGMGPTT